MLGSKPGPSVVSSVMGPKAACAGRVAGGRSPPAGPELHPANANRAMAAQAAKGWRMGARKVDALMEAGGERRVGSVGFRTAALLPARGAGVPRGGRRRGRLPAGAEP